MIGGVYPGGALLGGMVLIPSGGGPVNVSPTASSISAAVALMSSGPPFVPGTARSVSRATATITGGAFLILSYPTVLTISPYTTTLTIVI